MEEFFKAFALGITAFGITAAGVPAQAQGPTASGAIVAPGVQLEKVFAEGFWLEGPAAGPDGKIYFSDVTMTFRTGNAAGNIWVFDQDSGQTSLFRSPSGMSNGIEFDAEGRMVFAQGADFGARAVSRTDLRTGRSTILAGLYNGKPFNAPNDLVIDTRGRIYFTDPRYFGHEAIEQPVRGVYRIDTDGSVHLILADVASPNGIALSPDQSTLYVVEHDILVFDRRIGSVPQRTGPMNILAYDLSPEGAASNRRVLVNYPTGAGPDGITVDRAGNLYAAIQASNDPGVRVYDAQGTQLASIPMPERPTNVALATHRGRAWLYVTATTSLYRIETRAQR